MSLDNPFFISGLAVVALGLLRAAFLYLQVARERRHEESDPE
ncbi:hypothetical protein WB401_25060 [Streptomyces brasiliscabiei]|uniref:Secreted protein n=1 Tax=Streptomyces brasiliscabiei TaxID=2736302 RepID=A0ABU8GD52_9ACTN